MTMTSCPSCNCDGHISPFDGSRIRYRKGRPGEIHDCRFCDRIICTCCYIQHNEQAHQLYAKRSTPSSSESPRSSRRRSRAARSRSKR